MWEGSMILEHVKKFQNLDSKAERDQRNMNYQESQPSREHKTMTAVNNRKMRLR
jgi:hypothetical protein